MFCFLKPFVNPSKKKNKEIKMKQTKSSVTKYKKVSLQLYNHYGADLE